MVLVLPRLAAGDIFSDIMDAVDGISNAVGAVSDTQDTVNEYKAKIEQIEKQITEFRAKVEETIGEVNRTFVETKEAPDDEADFWSDATQRTKLEEDAYSASVHDGLYESRII